AAARRLSRVRVRGDRRIRGLDQTGGGTVARDQDRRFDDRRPRLVAATAEEHSARTAIRAALARGDFGAQRGAPERLRLRSESARRAGGPRAVLFEQALVSRRAARL